jgi:DNA-binding GntR family transcriptional regulator
MIDQPLPPTRDLAGTTSARVVAALREDILFGAFSPGARLKIADLAARYGVSSLPVREALQRLEGERLIELAAHRGATVRPLSSKLLANLYDVREALEGVLVERAAERVTAVQIASLERLQAHWEKLARTEDVHAMMQANLDFHCGINAIADNPEAEELVPRGWPMALSLRLRMGYTPDRLTAICEDHRAMLAALRARDAEAARRISRRHVRASCADLLSRLADAGLLPTDGCTP